MSVSEQIGFAEYVALRRDTWVRAACLLTADPHAAEDLVQTALIRVQHRCRHHGERGLGHRPRDLEVARPGSPCARRPPPRPWRGR